MKNCRFILLSSLVVVGLFVGQAGAQCINGLLDTLSPFGGTYVPGQTIEYVITVSIPNDPGFCTLENFQIHFFAPNNTTANPCEDPDGVLVYSTASFAPGDSVTITSTEAAILAYVVDEADVVGGKVTARICTSFEVEGQPDADSKTVQNNVVVPCVEVDKTVDPLTSKAGDEVTYTIRVCNCGPTDLTLVSVNDTILGDLTGDFSPTLLEGACEEHDFPYTVQPGDSDPLVNEVTVNYEYQGFAVDDDDDAEVDLVHPDFTITKDCLTDPIEPNSTAIFKVTIVNTGDVELNICTTEPAIPCPLVLPAGDTYIKDDITILAGTEDVVNEISAQATLPIELGLDNVIGPKLAEATCHVEQEGATRTLGFWKTHCEYTEHVFVEHCGGSLNLGWKTVNSIEDLLGILFANTAKNSGGGKRDALCQARIIASKQAVVALLNNCLDNGTTLPKTPGEIATILAGTDKTAIKQLGGLLDEYNNSGDDVAIIDLDGFLFGHATPQDCKEQANISFANCS